MDCVANFPSSAPPKQLHDQIKRKFSPHHALPISFSDIQVSEQPYYSYHILTASSFVLEAHGKEMVCFFPVNLRFHLLRQY